MTVPHDPLNDINAFYMYNSTHMTSSSLQFPPSTTSELISGNVGGEGGGRGRGKTIIRW